MKKSVSIVMLILFVSALFVSSVGAAGYVNSAEDPAPGFGGSGIAHAPDCKAGAAGDNYMVTCVDQGSDIRVAGVKFDGKPVPYTLKWDGKTAQISIDLSGLSGNALWYVTDRAGNTASGMVSR